MVIRAMAVVAMVLALATPGAVAAPGLVVKGDQKAWSEIVAALSRMNALKTYRAKLVFPGAPPGLFEAQNPDRFHTIMDFGGGAFETVQVGSEIRFREGKGKWQCTGQSAQPPNPDPKKMTGEVTATRGPAETVEGVRTQTYTYIWKSGEAHVPLTITAKVFVAVGTGLLRRIQLLDKGKVSIQYDYYDYNAPFTITLPSCG